MREGIGISQSKKPIFKKWWFWLIVIIVIIGIIVPAIQGNKDATKVGSDNNSSQQEKPKEEQQTEFKVGDVIAYDNKEITVKSIERNYNTGNEFSAPKDGMEYIKVNILIENKSDDRVQYNALDWEMQDANGNIEKYTDAALAQADDSLDSGELAKGGKKSGSIVFQVPKDSTGLILHYKSSFWSDKTVQIKL